MNRTQYAVAALLFALPVSSSPAWAGADVAAPSSKISTASASVNQGVTFPHHLLDRALAGRVSDDGTVDYVAIKGDKSLAAYITALAGADLTKFPDWDVPVPAPSDDDVPSAKREKKTGPVKDRTVELVLWINAYNAFVVQSLANAYPINSPDDIKGFDTAKIHNVAGKRYSLADLRGVISAIDPRALFAISDGTVGGPALAPKSYRFYDIGAALESAVTRFVNDPRNVKVLRIANQVTISDYFLVADGLFNSVSTRKKHAGIISVLASYTDQRDRAYLTAGDYQLIFIPRDRTLNIKEKSR
jgi:hypothetical protein